MATGNKRPLRTVEALARIFAKRWDRLTSLQVTDTGVSISFGLEAAPGEVVLHQPVLAQPPIKPDLPLAEPSVSDADLVLDIPKGMLVPQPLTEDSN